MKRILGKQIPSLFQPLLWKVRKRKWGLRIIVALVINNVTHKMKTGQTEMLLEIIKHLTYHHRHGGFRRGFIEMPKIWGITMAAFTEVVMLLRELSHEF